MAVRPDLSIEVVTRPDAVVIVLVGAAGIEGAEQLDRQLTLLSAKHVANVVFDLSRLTFISSICMGSLVRFHRACARWGGTITLAGANGGIIDAIRRARLDQLFVISEQAPVFPAPPA